MPQGLVGFEQRSRPTVVHQRQSGDAPKAEVKKSIVCLICTGSLRLVGQKADAVVGKRHIDVWSARHPSALEQGSAVATFIKESGTVRSASGLPRTSG